MRIFVLGDSYSDNLFQRSKETTNLPEITKYVDSVNEETSEKAKWWTDWLSEWGYEVFNYAIGGSTMESLIYQFAKIDENYEVGDRIILNLTHPSRYNWYDDMGNCMFIHNRSDQFQYRIVKDLIEEQAINRDISFNDNYLSQNLTPFLKYLINKHSYYRPIVWTTFWDVINHFVGYKYFFETHKIMNLRKDLDVKRCFERGVDWKSKLEMDKESSYFVQDGHFGRYGNYELAIMFRCILESNTDGYYLEDQSLNSELEKTILEYDKVFEVPKSWL